MKLLAKQTKLFIMKRQRLSLLFYVLVLSLGALVNAYPGAAEKQSSQIDPNVDPGDPKTNVHKRNLVGLSEHERGQLSLENLNGDAGDPKTNVRKRNLVGLSEQERGKEPLGNLNGDPGDPKMNVKKRNLVGLSEQERMQPPAPEAQPVANLHEDAGEPKINVKKRNLVGLSKHTREQKSLTNEDGDPKLNIHKRNLVGISKHQREQQSIAKVNEDAGEPVQNIRKRNLVAISKNARENVNAPSSVVDVVEDAGKAKQNVRKRNLVGLSKNLRELPHPDKQDDFIDFDLGADSGEAKQITRRRANLIAMAKSLRERPAASSDADVDDDDDADENDIEPQKPQVRSLDTEDQTGNIDSGNSGNGSSTHDGEHHIPISDNTEDQQSDNNPIVHPLPMEIKEDKLVGQNDKGSNVDSGYMLAKEDHQNRETPQLADNTARDQSFTLFTIANTDIGIDYGRVPYRERYLWDTRDAPCHSFNLKVPDEMDERSLITLCIFRPDLEFPDETKMFILNSGPENDNSYQQKVFGYVMNTDVSSVYGRIVDRFFYGEVSIYTQSTKITSIFVVEEINLLNRLMRNNQKTLKHMLMVMHGRGKDKDKMKTVYNAVITKGASLIDFMVFTNPTDINRNSFIMFSTNHNSYICPGEPVMQVDENGQISLESGANKISVENDGSVRMITKDNKEYTFRPHGRTIIKEGMEVRTLQEHEGSVAITAFTATSSYDCVLPTPAFQPKRKGGYVCKVCVAMDDLFTKYYLEQHTTDKEAESNYLGHIIDRVSWILRSIDFDEDKNPDNIGLDYDAQSLRWTYPDNTKEDLNEQDIELLFQSLAQYDFADCCIGLGYTMKNFPNSGFARRPSEKVSSPSGVCAGRTGRIPNNLIIISANDKKGNFGAISEKQLVYLTANQMASAFGASPDGAGDDVCDQFIDDHKHPRHYLLWPDVLRNTTLREQSLSSCSKKEILKTLSTCKSSCFDVDRHPFCGNGVVEEGEECDCGSEYNCKLQTCCYSRIGKHPCRKSGVGCKSESSSSSLFMKMEVSLLMIFSLLTISCSL